MNAGSPRRCRQLALLTLAAMALHAACAAEPTAPSQNYILDSARSRVGFSVKLMLLVNVEGRFGKIRGEVARNAFRDEIAVDAHIDAAAVSMSNHIYEEWVRSPEFFDVGSYPDIEFASEPIPQARLRKGGALPGMLTLRGVRKPVTFTLKASTCDRPGLDCAIEVHGSVRRSEFEMRSRRGALGDKVQLDFSVYAIAVSTAF